MRAANSWLGPDGQCAPIAGSRDVFCEKGLHGPVAADPQGDSYVQQLACEEDRPFPHYLLNRAGRSHEQKPESALKTSIGAVVRADRWRKSESALGHSRRFDRITATSGLHRSADILMIGGHVSKVPIGAIGSPISSGDRALMH